MKNLLTTTAIASAFVMCASSAFGAGFAIREQSASSQGASFAGSAAGYDLSSMFWNSAAAAVKSGPGINMESHYSAIFSHAQVEVDESSVIGDPASGNNVLGFFSNDSGDIAPAAFLGASYASYQLSEKLYLGFSLTSPFGLSTQPRDQNYQGAVLGRTTSLLTFNANPTVAYKIAPGVTIGAGFQVQYGDGTFKFATGLPTLPTTGFEGKGWAFGGTAGILLQPSAATSIGLGYRSRLKQNLDGEFFTNSGPGLGLASALVTDAEVDLELPDIVTLSIRQSISPTMRVMATVEWSNWSRFEDLTVQSKATGGTILGPTTPGATIASIPAGWSNGWFFSGGAEYDVYDYMTIRGGVAYEISPVDSPEKRLIGIPDNDRVWLSLGATVEMSEATHLDFAFTHIFIKDGEFDRDTVGGLNLQGEVEASTNIFSVSLKTKL